MYKYGKYIYFNSIKVQLEQTLSFVRVTLRTHFNSIKVQLELITITTTP